MNKQISLQEAFDSLFKAMQYERAQSQLTIGGLISVLDSMPKESAVANICEPHSYRGYYMDIAFEHTGGVRTAESLLAECKSLIGREFTGYKGGEFKMDEETPVWIASYGCTGEKLIALFPNGAIETQRDEAEKT